MTTFTKAAAAEAAVLPKAVIEMRDQVKAVADTATKDDISFVNELVKSGNEPEIVNLTPIIAALIFTNHNATNRSLSISRVKDYAGDMRRHEWKLNHQGIAFYPNGTLADGQHRTCAIAISGTTQQMLIWSDFKEDALDTIDRSTRRNAGESLEMNGVVDGKIKARISKIAMGYVAELAEQSTRFSDIQIEQFVIDHEDTLNSAINIGNRSIDNVSEPCLNKADAQTISLLMSLGGWPPHLIMGFISSVQTGVAAYPEAPTVFLSRIFTKAKWADRRKDKLTGRAKLALSLKGASLWANHNSVSKVVWNAKKESLPTNEVPDLPENSESVLIDNAA